MSFLQNTLLEHKKYYQELKNNGRNITIKQIMLILLIGLPYIGFIMIGGHLDSRTIVSHQHLIVVTSIIAVLLYLILFAITKERRNDLKIIWNILIVYINSILMFSTVLLLLNYFTANNKYVRLELPVVKWEQTRSQSGESTWATVKYENYESNLEFKGHKLDELENLEYIEVELSKGMLGYAHIKSIKIRKR